MAALDLLEGLTFGPTVQIQENNQYFVQYFWGEKNQGFDVLYHNMKHGQISVKSLQDFLRESAISEDLYAKHLTKLSKQAASSSPLGSFSPMFEVFKNMAEKLSSCHMNIHLKLHEIIKDLTKYSDEQKAKHKQIKDEVSSTIDALHLIESTKIAVQKSKEKYHQLCVEVEKLRKANSPPKEIEKAEGKAKKASDDYRNLVAKYANVRTDYDKKMSDSAKRFQEIEVAHLSHMNTVLETYIHAYEDANMLIGQVHQEFRKQLSENTIDSLLKKYSETKGTGTEKPAALTFEECDVSSVLVSVENVQTNGLNGDEPQVAQVQNKSSRLNLPFRRKKPRKVTKENVNGTKETDKEIESTDSPEKEADPKVDEEGFTIRPETPKGSGSRWGYESSDDSESDTDDFKDKKKIHVEIKPIEESIPADMKDGNYMNALNNISKNLTLGSPTPTGGKKLTPTKLASNVKQEAEEQQYKKKSSADELLDLFGGGESSTSTNMLKVNSMADFSVKKPANIDDNKRKFSQSKSSVSLDVLFSMSSKQEKNDDKTGPSKVDLNSGGNLSSNHSTPSLRPTNLSLSTDFNRAPIRSFDSLSSLSSIGGTPVDAFAISRGPSPLTLGFSDPVPIAVAFIETVNALFKGKGGESCVAKISGEVHISFPAGIIRNFTSNPNPPSLSFRIQTRSTTLDFKPNSNFLFADTMQSGSSDRSFWFDMGALIGRLKTMTDSNPTAPFYNITVLNYELLSESGHSLVPLYVSSSWTCQPDFTEIVVDYKYNSQVTSSSLKNLLVIVPVNGGVISENSTPDATWNSAQNRLVWKLSNSVSASNSSGSLNSKLQLSSGPTTTKTLAVQFQCEGTTLTGSEFELTGSGYRLSLVKKRFSSGKYLIDGN